MITDPILGLAFALAAIAWLVTIVGRRARLAREAREGYADAWVSVYGVGPIAEHALRLLNDPTSTSVDVEFALELERAVQRAMAEDRA